MLICAEDAADDGTDGCYQVVPTAYGCAIIIECGGWLYVERYFTPQRAFARARQHAADFDAMIRDIPPEQVRAARAATRGLFELRRLAEPTER